MGEEIKLSAWLQSVADDPAQPAEVRAFALGLIPQVIEAEKQQDLSDRRGSDLFALADKLITHLRAIAVQNPNASGYEGAYLISEVLDGAGKVLDAIPADYENPPAEAKPTPYPIMEIREKVLHLLQVDADNFDKYPLTEPCFKYTVYDHLRQYLVEIVDEVESKQVEPK